MMELLLSDTSNHKYSMNKLLIITPPDKIFNATPSLLLIKPSVELLDEFQAIVSNIYDDLNLFIFDDNAINIEWMLAVANIVDIIIIDVDNCDRRTLPFVSYLLAESHVYYITADDTIPYGLISNNRVDNLELVISSNFNLINEAPNEL